MKTLNVTMTCEQIDERPDACAENFKDMRHYKLVLRNGKKRMTVY